MSMSPMEQASSTWLLLRKTCLQPGNVASCVPTVWGISSETVAESEVVRSNINECGKTKLF